MTVSRYYWWHPLHLAAVWRDAEFLHAIAQRAGMKVECPRSAIRTFDNPVRLPEHGPNVLPFNRFKRTALLRAGLNISLSD